MQVFWLKSARHISARRAISTSKNACYVVPDMLTDLKKRKRLPDALRLLVDEFPRDTWRDHSNFTDLTEFWLSRHVMFREVLDRLQMDAAAALDGMDDFLGYKRRVHRFAGLLINELMTHHKVEDAHFFPVLSRQDTRLARGFDILDSDHHALDDGLHDLTEHANAVLQNMDGSVELHDAIGQLKTRLDAFEPLLNRHLLDEEELVVPVILKYAPEQLG